MAVNPNKLREGSSEVDRLEKHESILETNENLRNPDVQAAVSSIEGIENAESGGKVSEKSSESRDSKGSSLGGGTFANAYDPVKIKEQLLANHPNEGVMRKQIEKEINKEIKYLHKRAMKMMRSNGINYFEMNNILKKIRELKAILLILVKSSVDKVKTLWLRYVHGIM